MKWLNFSVVCGDFQGLQGLIGRGDSWGFDLIRMILENLRRDDEKKMEFPDETPLEASILDLFLQKEVGPHIARFHAQRQSVVPWLFSF